MSELRMYVLGDSLAAGVIDVHSDARQVAFGQIVAEVLREAGRPVAIDSAAWPGADAQDGATRQLARAARFAPDIAAVWLGLNDVLKLRFDAELVERHLDRVLGQLARTGCRALTATMPLPREVLPFPGWSLRRASERVARLNEAVERTASRWDTLHLDLPAELADLSSRELLGPDGVHLSPLGHLRVAQGYVALLQAQGVAPSCALDVARRREVGRGDLGAVDRLAWYATHGARYVVRRATTGRLQPSAEPPVLAGS